MAPQSNAPSNGSTDSLLARVFEESIRLQRHQEHSDRERELRELQREEQVLEESRRTFVDRAREEANEEEEQLRLAMERSAADEQERTARREREREERARLDREFGSGESRGATRREPRGERRGRDGGRPETAPAPPSSASTSSRNGEHSLHASPSHDINSNPPSSTPPENSSQEDEPPLRRRRHRTRREITDDIIDELIAEEEASHNRRRGYHRQSRAHSPPETGRFQARQSRIAEELGQGPQQPRNHDHEVAHSRSHFENPISRLNTTSSHRSEFGPGEGGRRMHTVLPPRRTNSDIPEIGAPYGVHSPHSGPRHVHYHRHHHHHNPARRSGRGPLIDPSAYSLSEIVARSRTDAYPTDAHFTEEGLEFNHHQLQAAINASADQGRDPDEEAVQRNMDCPTYEEACAMRRYKPRRGDRYVFQGPNVVEIEGDEGANQPSVRMEIVGEMDLAEAMRVANRGRNKNRNQNTVG